MRLIDQGTKALLVHRLILSDSAEKLKNDIFFDTSARLLIVVGFGTPAHRLTCFFWKKTVRFATSATIVASVAILLAADFPRGKIHTFVAGAIDLVLLLHLL